MNTKQKEESLTLEILEAIEAQSDVTQRSLAKRMNVALGLANSYLKRCVKKGWVKIHQAPANRYLYYLTPTGFAEKGRLTAEYLSISFSFYRKAGDSCRAVFRQCAANGTRRVVLCGCSDLAEIASVRALETNVEIVAIWDPNSNRSSFLTKPVMRELSECEPFDACLVTDLNDPAGVYEDVTKLLGAQRVLVPSILGINPAE